MNAGLRRLGKPVRTVLLWQVSVTAVLALIGAGAAGIHGALSVVLGGAVSIVAGLVAASLVARRTAKTKTASAVLLAAIRAEAVRIGLIVILLWLVMATYQSVVVPVFFGAFIVTLLIFSLAFFVREDK